MKLAPEVEKYLASVPAEARAALEEVRTWIRELLPEAEETLSYQIPTFKVGGKGIVAYGAMKDHLSFFTLSPAVIERFRAELDPYKVSKGTIRFDPKNTIPKELVHRLVRARLDENEALAAAKRGKP